jgi:hypothetical protein
MDQNREPESILHLPQFHAFDARLAPGWPLRGTGLGNSADLHPAKSYKYSPKSTIACRWVLAPLSGRANNSSKTPPGRGEKVRAFSNFLL